MYAEGILMAPQFVVAARATTTARRMPNQPMDEAKFEAFYRKTAGKIWSYIYRMTGDATAADDLLQKTFFRFLRSNPAIADEDHLRRYIYKTATNLVFDHFREAKQERALLWLAHVEGSSHEEIGEALGVKEKSVKVMLFRARKRLGALLSKKGL